MYLANFKVAFSSSFALEAAALDVAAIVANIAQIAHLHKLLYFFQIVFENFKLSFKIRISDQNKVYRPQFDVNVIGT